MEEQNYNMVDNVLLELSERVLGRLKGMSDEEFAKIDFIAAE